MDADMATVGSLTGVMWFVSWLVTWLAVGAVGSRRGEAGEGFACGVATLRKSPPLINLAERMVQVAACPAFRHASALASAISILLATHVQAQPVINAANPPFNAAPGKDSGPGIQMALDAAKKMGGATVFIPRGIYTIGKSEMPGECVHKNRPLVIYTHTRLIGEGVGQTILMLADNVQQPMERGLNCGSPCHFNAGLLIDAANRWYFDNTGLRREEAVTHGIEIAHLTIDGNQDNQVAIFTPLGTPTEPTVPSPTHSLFVDPGCAQNGELAEGQYTVFARYLISAGPGAAPTESYPTNLAGVCTFHDPCRKCIVASDYPPCTCQPPCSPGNTCTPSNSDHPNALRVFLPPQTPWNADGVVVYVQHLADTGDTNCGVPVWDSCDPGARQDHSGFDACGNALFYRIALPLPACVPNAESPRSNQPCVMITSLGTDTGYQYPGLTMEPGEGSGACGIYLDRVRHAYIHDVDIRNCVAEGCMLLGAEDCRFEDVAFQHNGRRGAGIAQAYADNQINITFSRCVFAGNLGGGFYSEPGSGPGSGGGPVETNGLRFSDCVFRDHLRSGQENNCDPGNVGLLVAARATHPCRNLTIDNCTFENNVGHVSIASGPDANVNLDNAQITHCTFGYCYARAIQLTCGAGGRIENCVFNQADGSRSSQPPDFGQLATENNDIELSGSADGWLIRRNCFRMLSWANTTVAVEATTTWHHTITDNSFFTNGDDWRLPGPYQTGFRTRWLVRCYGEDNVPAGHGLCGMTIDRNAGDGAFVEKTNTDQIVRSGKACPQQR